MKQQQKEERKEASFWKDIFGLEVQVKTTDETFHKIIANDKQYRQLRIHIEDM